MKDTEKSKKDYNHELFKNMSFYTDAVWDIDVNAEKVNIIHDIWNPNFTERIFGFEEAASIMKLACADQIDFLIGCRMLNREYLLELTGTVTFEIVLRIRGKNHTVVCSLTPVFDEDNKVYRAYVSFHDVYRLNNEKERLQRESGRAKVTFGQQTSETLAGAKIGMWNIIMGDGRSKLLMDSTTAELVGAPWNATQEEAYDFWYEHVDPDYRTVIHECSENMIAGDSGEVQYPYHHPKYGIIYIRCGGSRDFEYVGKGIKLRGYHQDISKYQKETNRANQKAEYAQQQAEEQLDMLGELSSIAMWCIYYDQEGRISRCNWGKGFTKLLGYGENENLEPHISVLTNILHPDEIEEAKSELLHAEKKAGLLDITHRLKMKNGMYEYFRARGKVSFREEGTPRIFIGFMENITEVENESRDVDSKLITLMGGVNGGLLVSEVDEIFTYTYINEHLVKMLGYEDAEEMKQAHSGGALFGVHEDDRDVLKRSINQQLLFGDDYTIGFRTIHKNGSIIWVNGFGHKATLPDGSVRLYSLIQNVTERETARLRLEAEQRKYRDALANDAIYAFTADLTEGVINEDVESVDGNYMLMSMGLKAPVKYDEANRIFADCYNIEILTPNGQAFFTTQGLLDMYENGYSHESVEYRIPETDKYIRVIPLLAEDPISGHIIANIFAHDITNVKRHEIESREALRDALVASEQSNRSKTVFLNNMSHDIRTPMNAIIGFTDLALRNVHNPAKVANNLKKIKISGEHLLRLINDILDMSRIESGKMNIENAKISLMDIMRDIQSMVQTDANSKGIKSFFEVGHIRDEIVMADKLRITQVILNCLSNSVKFTDKGGAVSFGMFQLPCEDENKASFEFVVKDNGIGMSEEFVKHIFEAFERERSSTVSGIQGTGLGMSITKSLVDMMGGDIRVDSLKNVGTTITINLTFDKAKDVEKPHITCDYSQKRALVIDGIKGNLENFRELLDRVNIEADGAYNLEEALEKIKASEEDKTVYDLVFADCTMEDFRDEKSEKLREELEKIGACVVFTAYDSADTDEIIEKFKPYAFIEKPLFMSELCRVLDAIICKNEKLSLFETPEEIDFNGLKILLVEDNALNREIAETLLTESGAVVSWAEDGRKALHAVMDSEAGTFDVILMDVQMPNMNGYQATEMIRALDDPAKSGIPIIAMTANAFEEDRKLAEEAGMDGHIPKPINLSVISKTIKRVLATK